MQQSEGRMAQGNGRETLEARIRLIEDRLEIYNLIASHPPSADTGASDYTRSVWTEDGVFDRGDEFAKPAGGAAIAATSASVEHHRAIEQGIAHFAGLPYVRVTGDTAFAISYLQILVPDRVGPVFEVPNHGATGGFHVHRVSANRWDFVRTAAGWRIKSRRLRSLDGSEGAREILRGTFAAGG
jgi:SnoaL-like domain